jgi:hypothetical protein
MAAIDGVLSNLFVQQLSQSVEGQVLLSQLTRQEDTNPRLTSEPAPRPLHEVSHPHSGDGRGEAAATTDCCRQPNDLIPLNPICCPSNRPGCPCKERLQ